MRPGSSRLPERGAAVAGAAEDAPPAGFALFEARGPAEALLGPYYWSVGAAARAMGFRVKPHHLNRNGVCHGGVMSAFADAQSAVLKLGTEFDGVVTPTVSLSVDFIGPAPSGAWVQSAPVLLRATARLMFVTAEIRADGEMAARMSGIYRITGRTVGQAGSG